MATIFGSSGKGGCSGSGGLLDGLFGGLDGLGGLGGLGGFGGLDGLTGAIDGSETCGGYIDDRNVIERGYLMMKYNVSEKRGGN